MTQPRNGQIVARFQLKGIKYFRVVVTSGSRDSLVGQNFNWSCVKNGKLDQLLEQGRRESDPVTGL